MAFTPTGVEFVAKNLGGYLGDLTKADKAQQNLGDSADSIGGKFTKSGSSLLKFGAIAGGAALAGVTALAAGVVAIGVKAVQTSISFESAFAGVIKTTDGLTSSVGVLNEQGEALRQEFVNLSKTVPTTFEELAAIGELGGQLGIAKDQLIEFSGTVAALGEATNLAQEEAASGLAQIANIFAVSTDEMGENITRMGSTLVALGNTFATTERDILNFGQRIAGAGAIAGLTQADIFGIGTAFSSVGIEAEAGGTAVQKVLLAINAAVAGAETGFVDFTDKIDKNVKKLTKLNAESARLEAQFPGLQSELLAQKEAFIAAGGSAEDFGRQLGDKARQKALEVAESIRDLQNETNLLKEQQGKPIEPKLLNTFAKVAGISADEFKEAWEKDAAGAFEMFVSGLGAQGDDAIATLEDLGLTDQRLIRAFLSVAGAGDLLSRTLETSNDAFEENTALAEEAAQRYATTESKIAIFKNQLRALADSIGVRLLPIFNKLIDFGTKFVEKLARPIQNVLDNRVIPAIDRFTNFVKGAFETFQAGGLFGKRFGSFGSEGLLAFLGFEPRTITIIQSFVGEISTVFDNISQLVTSFISLVSKGNFSDIVDFGKTLASVFGVDLETAFGITGGIVGVISNIQLVVSKFIDTLLDIGMSLATGGVFGEGGLLATLGFSPDMISTIQSVIASVLSGIGQVIGFIGGLDLESVSFASIFSAEGIQDTLSTIVSSIASFLENNWPVIQATLNQWRVQFWEWVTPLALEAVDKLGVLAQAIADWAAAPETSEMLAGLGMSIGRSIVTGLQNNFALTEQLVPIAWTLINGLLAVIVSLTASFISIGAEIVANIFAGIVQSFGGDVKVGTVAELEAMADWMVNGVDWSAVGLGLMALIGEGITGAFENIKGTIEGIWTNIKTIMSLSTQNAAQDVSNKFRELIDDIKSIFSGEKFMEIGKLAIDGLIKGMKENANKVISAIKKIVKNAIDTMLSSWGIGSPSKVTTEMGEQIINGLILGIKEKTGALNAEIDSAAEAVIGGFKFIFNQVHAELEGLGVSPEDMIVDPKGMGSFLSNLKKNITGTLTGAIATGGLGLQDIADDLIGTLMQNIAHAPNQLIGEHLGQFADKMYEVAQNALMPIIAKIGRDIAVQLISASTQFTTLGKTAVDRALKPIEAELEAAEDALENFNETIDETTTFEDVKKSIVDAEDEISKLHQFQEDLLAIGQDLSEEDKARIIELESAVSSSQEQLALLDERAAKEAEVLRLQEEQAALKEKQLKIEQQQADLQFLQQQLDLLKTIEELGLDPKDILGDIQLGLDADLGALADAMASVVETIIGTVNATLEISSPSKVMMGIGENIIGGLIAGMESVNGSLQSAIGPMLQDGLLTAGTTMPAGGGSNTTNSVSFGDIVMKDEGMSSQQLQEVILRTVSEAVG